MPSIAGAIIFDSPAIIAIIGSPAASSGSSATGAPRAVAISREQVAVGVERAARPLAARHDLRLGRRVAGADDVGDVEPGDAGEVGERQPHGRVDVGLRGAARGAELGELAGRVPVQRTLTLQRLGQVAEHRQRGEGIVGPFLGTGVVGHGVDAMPTADDPPPPRRPSHVPGQGRGYRRRRVIEHQRSRRHRLDGAGAGPRHRRRGQPRPGGCWRCSPTIPPSSTARRRRPTSSSTSVPASTTCGPAAGRTSPTAPPQMLDDGDRRPGQPPRARVVGDGLRRLRQQPGAADRGRHPAARRRVRLRPPAGHGRGAGRPVAAGRARAGPSPCCARSWRWPPTARRRSPGRWPPGFGQRFGEDDPPAQFLHLDDLASAVVLAVDQRLDGVFNVAPDGWVAGRAGARPDRRPAAHPAARPRRRGRRRGALAVPARPDPARPAQLHPGAVARRQRPAEGARLAPDGHQRAGLRRGHRGAVVDDDHAQAAPGAGARRDGAAVAGRPPASSLRQPVVAPPAAAEPTVRPSGRDPSLGGDRRGAETVPLRSRRPRSRRSSAGSLLGSVPTVTARCVLGTVGRRRGAVVGVVVGWLVATVVGAVDGAVVGSVAATVVVGSSGIVATVRRATPWRSFVHRPMRSPARVEHRRAPRPRRCRRARSS